MKKIAILTLSMGRDRYLMDLIDSLMGSDPTHFDHFILFQGTVPSMELASFMNDAVENGYPLRFSNSPDNLGIGLGLEKMKELFLEDWKSGTQLIIKMDDDCVIRSPDFTNHILELAELNPTAVFSPFPVGLIGNLAGPPLVGERRVELGHDMDTYYTIRPVLHLGGFARVSPAKLFMDFKFVDDKSTTSSGWEDGHFSNMCNKFGIEMFYLENALIVEHNESTLGQHLRYGKDYFKNRNV